MSLINNVLALTGDDAVVNSFSVIIPPTFPGCIDPEQINLRVTKLDLPSITYGTYDVHWKTEQAVKPNGKQTTDKKITIGFRIDKNWTVFKSFLNWSKAIHNPSTGGASPDFVNGQSLIRVPITILFTDANNLPTTSPEVYNGCMIDEIPARAYTYKEGDNIEMDFSFHYIDMIPTT